MSTREMARRIVGLVTLPDAQGLVLTDVIEETIRRVEVAARKDAFAECAAIADANNDVHGNGPAIAAAIRARGES